MPSAFGYNEAQLRFHEGNALTHLHDTEAAWRAQQRALQLYPPSDYLDRTLLQLDRASCLAFDGDVTSAMGKAASAVGRLAPEQRSGMILMRGGQILGSLSDSQRELPAARDFRDFLTSCIEGEVEHPPC
jgi:hypothetical protein